MEGYAEVAADLVPRFEAISSAKLYAPVLEYLPTTAARVLDVGAGTGRDAAWLAGLGHDVVAAEPVAELRQAAIMLRPDSRVRWLDDSLPRLDRVLGQGRTFDLVLVNAVWQHLDARDRAVAMSTLTDLLGSRGTLIISLRHGAGAPKRPCFPCAPFETILSGEQNGLSLVCKRAASSVQAANQSAGVTWTWLVFGKYHSQRQAAADIRS